MAATDCLSRTDQLRNQHDYHPLYQLSICSLPDYSILYISEFVLDYMHLVCLGVTRQMLTFMKEGSILCNNLHNLGPSFMNVNIFLVTPKQTKCSSSCSCYQTILKTVKSKYSQILLDSQDALRN